MVKGKLKKRFLALGLLYVVAFTSCQSNVICARETGDNIAITQLPGTTVEEKSYDDSFLSVTGYAADGVSDRTHFYEEYVEYNRLLKEQFLAEGGKEEDYVYQNTENYFVANNEQEFCEAIASECEVVELTADLNLGFKYLEKNEIDSYGVVNPINDYNRGNEPITSPDLMEDGVSMLEISERHGMTIFSRNGSTIYHCELAIKNSSDIVIRNLGFQGMNEFDDIPFGEAGVPFHHKRYDWDGISVYASQNVWIDHCTFGNCYDGTIDITDISTVTITWCQLGVLDEVSRQELENNIAYMEELYQKGNGFQFYTALRDAKATPEQIIRFVDLNDKVHAYSCNELCYDLNTKDCVTMGYNYYHNSCQRVPQIYSGVAHMFNCYVDSTEYMQICDEISEARSYAASKGCSVLGLCRANSAREGGTIGTDTCVFEGVTNPIIGEEKVTEGVQKGSLNHNLIVNSSTQQYGSDEVYVGSSWDNNGENAFVSGDGYWNGGKVTINNFKWANWVPLTRNEEEAVDGVVYLPVTEAQKLVEGEFYKRYYIGSDTLDYEYQIFPLNEVKTTLATYGGCGAVTLNDGDWLKTTYGEAEGTYKVVIDDGVAKTPNKTYTGLESCATVSLPEVPEKTGYTFKGWCTRNYYLDEDGNLAYEAVPFTETTPVTADTYVFAEWEIIKYKVTLELNGGTTEGSTVYEYNYNSYVDVKKIDTSLLQKDGYLFKHWCMDEALEKQAAIFKITEDTTIYAKWVEVTEEPVPTETVVPQPSETATPTETPAPTNAPYEKGDVDDSKNVDLTDANTVLRAALGIVNLEGRALTAADYDGNEVVNLTDAQLVLQKALGII